MNTLEPLDYQCKFCRRPGVAYYDPACPGLRLQMWQSVLACDRCADYYDGFNRIAAAIRATCLLQMSVDSIVDDDVRDVVVKKVRERLTAKTRGMAAHVCRHFNVTTVWQADFVDMLVEKPDASFVVLQDYARRIKAIAQGATL